MGITIAEDTSCFDKKVFFSFRIILDDLRVVFIKFRRLQANWAQNAENIPWVVGGDISELPSPSFL